MMNTLVKYYIYTAAHSRQCNIKNFSFSEMIKRNLYSHQYHFHHFLCIRKDDLPIHIYKYIDGQISKYNSQKNRINYSHILLHVYINAFDILYDSLIFEYINFSNNVIMYTKLYFLRLYIDVSCIYYYYYIRARMYIMQNSIVPHISIKTAVDYLQFPTSRSMLNQLSPPH